MKYILKMLVIIGSVVILGGYITDAYRCHYARTINTTDYAKSTEFIERRKARNNVSLMLKRANQAKMGGGVLMLLSLAALSHIQDGRIKRLEECQQAGPAYPPQGVGSADP